ncbi:MAG: DUF2946 family protein [Burkholderiaceae bacterium]
MIAMLLFALHSLIPACLLGAPAAATAASGAVTVVCTTSGLRVVMLEMAEPGGSSQDAPHDASIPHCCTAGCTMSGTSMLPGRYLAGWFLPDAPASQAYRNTETSTARPGSPATLPGRPRGPPRA